MTEQGVGMRRRIRTIAASVAATALCALGLSVGIGSQATHTGNTGRPGAFALNGTPCAVA
jgi:hypothetical protein